MKRLLIIVFLTCCLATAPAAAQSFPSNVAPLIEASCLHCHDADTDTGLNLAALGHDLTDAETFRRWEKVFDRVEKGEMPPESEARPAPRHLDQALTSLRAELQQASIARQQRVGRVPARRLTKLELGYTFRDLLRIDGDVTSNVPDEVISSTFDTVGSNQRLSAVHMENILKAADEALDLAIRLESNPYRRHELNFMHNPFLDEFHEKPIDLGGNVSRKLDDGVALFRDVDYLLTSGFGGFAVPTPGIYRITTKIAAYQSSEPVTMKLIQKEPSGGAQLLQSHDLTPGETETIVVEAYLKPGDTFYTTLDLDAEPFAAIIAAGGAKNYKGIGISLKSQFAEGPLAETWPPPSTRQLLDGLVLTPDGSSSDKQFRIEEPTDPQRELTDLIRRLAPLAFRRPPAEGEIESFVDLAKPLIAEEREFVEVLRIPLRSMLSSPQFLLFGGEPGELDDYALANRLSYFLWKSMPDEELFGLAGQGKLKDRQVLAKQVDRMLADEKSSRFVRDFLGQWLRLYQVNATTPDENLYPDYDELLGNAIPREPELFFTELLRENLSVANLIDAEFTFVNRRLAEHYGIPGVDGQQFRKVALPDGSPRGGVLTQAAILKTTANGTVTSPVMRGNFVLTNFLGTPPSPPPPSVGSIEPDTRGKTTIREILAAHRNIETCAKCHREIDPPGFALESFDPIGGFRTKYRATSGAAPDPSLAFFGGKTYFDGPPVDASGVTADGRPFADMKEFKQHLLDRKEQVARNFIAQIVVYSTGGEIQFADRAELQVLLDRTRERDFRVKDIIHQVVQSSLFRNK